MVRVSTPANSEFPHLSNNTNTINPKRPNTIEGIPANVSVVSLITLTNFEFLFEYSTRYIAAAIPIGTAITVLKIPL